jgi:hypothetical protein
MTDQKIENFFFGKLANKLEELYPKHISKERSTALVFNAFANMIFKECIAEVRRETIEEKMKEIEVLKTNEDGKGFAADSYAVGLNQGLEKAIQILKK